MADVDQDAPTQERDAHRSLREKRARLSSWTSLAGRGLGMLASIVIVGVYPRVLTDIVTSGVAPIAKILGGAG